MSNANENTEAQASAVQASEPETVEAQRTFTQAEVNSFLAKEKRSLAEKYSDYEDLKKQLAEFEAAKASGLTEVQRLQLQVEQLEAGRLKELRSRVAAQFHMPLELVTGTSEEECVAQGEAFKKVLDQAKPAGPSSKALGNPTKGAPALNCILRKLV